MKRLLFAVIAMGATAAFGQGHPQPVFTNSKTHQVQAFENIMDFQGITVLHLPGGGGGGGGNVISLVGDNGTSTGLTLNIGGTVQIPTLSLGGALKWTSLDLTGAALPISAITGLQTALNAKAADAAVLHTTGNETKGGVLTLTSAPVVPDNSFAEGKILNLVSDLAAKQAANANLTALAAISTQPFGLGFLAQDTDTNSRTYIGLGNVDNTSDATKNSAAVSLTNHTIDGRFNSLTHIPTSAIEGWESSTLALSPPDSTQGLVWDTALNSGLGAFRFVGSPTVRGLNKDVYIAVRTDSKDGTGTSEDPYDGSTQVKFDAIMADSSKTPANANIYLCAGTFLTKGNVNYTPRSGWKLHLTAQTTIKMDVLSSADVTAANGPNMFGRVTGGTLVEDISVDGGTWDCNMQNQTHATSVAAIAMIADGFTVRNAKFINWGNTASPELFVVGAFSNGTSYARIHKKGVLIENCEWTQPAAVTNNGTITLLNAAGGQNVITTGSLSYGWFGGVTVRNNYFHDIADANASNIDCVNLGGWVEGYHCHNNRFMNITGSNARLGYYWDTGSGTDIKLENDEFVNVVTPIKFLNQSSYTRDKVRIHHETMTQVGYIGIDLPEGITASDYTISNCYISGSGTTAGINGDNVQGIRFRDNTINVSTGHINNFASAVVSEKFNNRKGDGTFVSGDEVSSIKFSDGTASAPGISFTSDTNTGIYRSTADEIDFATGGVQRGYVDAFGLWHVRNGAAIRIIGDSGFSGGALQVDSSNIRFGTTAGTRWGQFDSSGLTLDGSNVVAGSVLSGHSARSNTQLWLGGYAGGSSRVHRIGTGSVDNNPDYGFFLDTNYSANTSAILGVRDGSTDYDTLTLTPTGIQALGYKSGDGTAGASTTTGGATFKNGLYTSGTITTTPATGSITDTQLASAVKPAVAVVATSNLTLSGEQTIDGQLTSTSLVLATAQSTGSQNGPWITAAGAWARPGWYTSGSTTQAPQFMEVMHARLGTSHQGEVWKMTTAAVTIDTTATTWTLVPPNVNNAVGTLPVANGGTGIASFGSGIATFLGTPSSANLASAVTDETGSGALVFGTAPTLTGATVDSGTLTLSGNQSAAAWTTNGIRLKGISGTLTDTTSSGTVAAAYTNKLGGNTIAASSATTFTDYISSYFSEPTAGTNVTLTNKWGLGADSLYVGTSNPFKVTSAGAATFASSVNGPDASFAKFGGIYLGGNSTKQLTLNSSGGVINWGSSGLNSPDVGISRLGVNSIAFGNGTANDVTATLGAGILNLGAAGAASTPTLKLSGTPFAGTGTTSFPLVYLNDSAATASTTLATAGTYLGVNGHGTADLLNLLVDGTSKFKISSSGVITANSGNFTTDSAFISSGAYMQTSSAAMNLNESGVRTTSAGIFGFLSGTTITASHGTIDTAFGRNGVGIAEVNSGTLGTLRDIKYRKSLPLQTAAGTQTSTYSLDVTLGESWTLTSTASTAMTITPTAAGTAGQRVVIIINGDATGGDVITFASPFKPNGTMTLTASKGHTITFISDGTNLWETGRVTGL
jgi:hypothetical protein